MSLFLFENKIHFPNIELTTFDIFNFIHDLPQFQAHFLNAALLSFFAIIFWSFATLLTFPFLTFLPPLPSSTFDPKKVFFCFILVRFKSRLSLSILPPRLKRSFLPSWAAASVNLLNFAFCESLIFLMIGLFMVLVPRPLTKFSFILCAFFT
mgnify:CR=1 FL=1